MRHVAAVSAAAAGPVGSGARVTLNFHPDRWAAPRAAGERARWLTLAALAADGTYVSQFVTGTGNGGLTAYPGGDRWRWESRIFGGAYDERPAAERPVYGALDFRSLPAGAAPRFGSAHLRLTREALARATFCYPDSAEEPADFGTAARMALVELAEAGGRDRLDDYVEAHVHGPVRLDRDVEALVLDPSHRGTQVEAAARTLPCPVRWHAGFRLTVEELRRHPDYRGPRFTELGASLAEDGVLDPRMIGDAARAGRHDPQDLKKVWHLLARFGAAGDRGQRPAGTGGPDAEEDGAGT
ncbi:DUF3626 domain-containing protein [Streptomyces sp. V4-01]|uniref:DUF3626 domain-containing protein n=1 Tax=Actinacidiphila polyblastidii TaxID=3110430 RepID=A0ABU7PEZ0_9ACTN|nr:DUF3626 domain-containing protein [Streptomyces sp. V4-01]